MSTDDALAQILKKLDEILTLHTRKDRYTIKEAAARLNRKPLTVQLWLIRGQAKGKKVPGRGGHEWRLSHDEVVRLGAEGPAPLGTYLEM